MTSVDKEDIGKVLNDQSRPLKERFRALFTLRNLGGKDSIDMIAQSFQDGEALGAIGSSDVMHILEKYSADPVTEVAETCQLAIARLKWLQNSQNEKDNLSENPYLSVDPAPPETRDSDTQHLTTTLLDENLPLFERYRALFSLRNMGTTESVVALAKGLKCKSALFRHEIAYVLGQVQHDACIKQLTENLKDPEENPMVRHECAEALGSIATDECMKILHEYLKDKERVVKESCEVALDMCEYEKSTDFQYADTMAKLKQGENLMTAGD
ncbi:DOHH-like protein [Mya arenaria]|uniref:DOHH-like protein n=1 Tax=Mya arenaria TaxID=6604 RepID=A0ABY7FRM1_MYAAR|nr:DOHH-like protein [Mya arenaria]